MKLTELLREKYLILDGAMGTLIALDGAEALEEADGCNELLNVTAPTLIASIHDRYLEAGADIIKSNSFGALPWVLEEFGLANRTEELCAAAVRVAKSCAARYSDKPRFVAASLGPGTKLPSLGHIGFDAMYDGYKRAITGAIGGGADLLLFETCQDPLQIKAALIAANDLFDTLGFRLEIMVSATIELTQTMLIGTSVATLAAILEPFELLSIGINCGVGPDKMRSHIDALAANSSHRLSIHANAGLPLNVGGKSVYPMGAEDFAALESSLAETDGVALLGGCCGTTPRHIAALVRSIEGRVPKPPKPKTAPALTSLFSVRKLFDDRLFLIGERANATGSKAFRDLLLLENYEAALEVANEQIAAGADALDLSVGFAGRSEERDMVEIASRFALSINAPLMIDSTKESVIETGLKLVGGRAIINSANLEDGEARFVRIARLAKRFGTALVCLAIDETGMARTVEKKLEVAERMLALALREGLREHDLFFDLLTFTIASGEAEYRHAAMDTIDAIAILRERHPAVGAVLGVSNVSFGLKGYSRELLNSVFLRRAQAAGLTMAIINARTIVPLRSIADDDRAVCERLILGNEEEALFAFIAHFERKSGGGAQPKQTANDFANDPAQPIEETLSQMLIAARKEELIKLLPKAMEQVAPNLILNEILIGAMKEVGERFGDGRMQLPFVLKSAETMKAAADFLAPYLPKSSREKPLKIVIGTVRGDVHDVGKNLVDILLSNNGFEVVNIGVKVEYEAFIRAFREHNADAIGMSGLLVKSTQVMAENLAKMQADGLRLPVLLGGAALNRKFVAEYCQSVYDAPVVYCRDAFDAIAALSDLSLGKLTKTAIETPALRETIAQKTAEPTGEFVPTELVAAAVAPFWGRRELTVPPELVFEWLDQNMLFKTRWGYGKRGSDYRALLRSEILPTYERLKAQILNERLFEPVIIYGFYAARSEGERLIIYDEAGEKPLREIAFARSEKDKRRSIVDYFRADRDTAGFLVASAGVKLGEYVKALHGAGSYADYHFLSALAGELAEAAAEIAHKQIRIDLAITNGETPDLRSVQTRGYTGKRYAPGYAACPDLAINRVIFDLLRPEVRGLNLTEHFSIDPEASTCAIVCAHPEAEYFTVGGKE
ncbi:5-methyltetrahydrofolate--homocysteine methyltransferase [Campylobacterota bacterium]|nr:5-methyltetrahydrofolate--homocysteine methyltransferase [Campylobacterota bacterium]